MDRLFFLFIFLVLFYQLLISVLLTDDTDDAKEREKKKQSKFSIFVFFFLFLSLACFVPWQNNVFHPDLAVVVDWALSIYPSLFIGVGVPAVVFTVQSALPA